MLFSITMMNFGVDFDLGFYLGFKLLSLILPEFDLGFYYSFLCFSIIMA